MRTYERDMFRATSTRELRGFCSLLMFESSLCFKTRCNKIVVDESAGAPSLSYCHFSAAFKFTAGWWNGCLSRSDKLYRSLHRINPHKMLSLQGKIVSSSLEVLAANVVERLPVFKIGCAIAGATSDKLVVNESAGAPSLPKLPFLCSFEVNSRVTKWLS